MSVKINLFLKSKSFSGEDVILGLTRVLSLDISSNNREDDPSSEISDVSPVGTEVLESGSSLSERWESTKI